MGDDRTPAIDAENYLSGTTVVDIGVVDIGDLRVARGKTRRPASTCRHHKMMYDIYERRIWCPDCEHDVEPFDAFRNLVEHFDNAEKRVQRLMQETHEASKFAIISRAAKAIDRQWRRRNTVPSCPHCHAGIWPEDALHMGSVNKEWDKASRARASEAGER